MISIDVSDAQRQDPNSDTEAGRRIQNQQWALIQSIVKMKTDDKA